MDIFFRILTPAFHEGRGFLLDSFSVVRLIAMRTRIKPP